MFNILLVVLSVALLTQYLLAGLNYINPNQYFSIQDENLIRSSVSNLSSGASSYALMSGHQPTTTIDIIPHFSSEPSLPKGLMFNSLVNNSGVVSYCFNGSVSESTYRAVARLALVDEYVFVDNCDDLNSISIDEPTFPLLMSFIYKRD